MSYDENQKYLKNDAAKEYDRVLPDYYFFDFDSKEYVDETHFLENYLKNMQFNSVLELGVGTGRMTNIVLPHAKKYFGIDYSPSMVKKTISRFSNRPSTKFEVYSITDFINESKNISDYDFLCSFYAYNYSLLSFFEYYNSETKIHGQFEDLSAAEDNAKVQITKLFGQLKKGTRFILYYFDAYSVEQSYVTRVLEQELPFVYDDRGYTLKVLLNTLKSLPRISFNLDHKNGYALLEDTQHLIDYYSSLHLNGSLNTFEDKMQLVNAFKVYQQGNGQYHVPAGVNVISGIVK